MIIIIMMLIIIIIIIIMMMMMMMMMTMIIIIAFKGAIHDFLQSPLLRLELSPTRTLKWPGRDREQITCNTSSAYHVQHVLRVTWYEGTAQLLNLTQFEIAFILASFCWLDQLNR